MLEVARSYIRSNTGGWGEINNNSNSSPSVTKDGSLKQWNLTMVEPSFGERSLINHRDYLTNGRIVTSSIVNITETQVLTVEGRLIFYDYLVIATGHIDTILKTRTERLNQYQAGKTWLYCKSYHVNDCFYSFTKRVF